MSEGRQDDSFCFGVPPSLGHDPVRELARNFADVLYGAGFSTVVPKNSYEDLEQALLSGEVDAAWGPPMVCSRVEAAGGMVALRAVRYGAVTYRSVLICRSRDPLDIRELGSPSMSQVRAAWVDRWSMGGYILPRHHLRSLGLDLSNVLSEDTLLGSYEACFKAVLDGQADITASFANRRGLGYVELCGDRAFEMRTLAYTDECPNDGVVLSPKLGHTQSKRLFEGLSRLIAHPASLGILAATFDVDGFDRPPAGCYAPLLSMT